ncbi:MAG: class F sortase [Patescibacteria group bacterium]|nr:class F sortase [Patescibacteria group bacterium]
MLSKARVAAKIELILSVIVRSLVILFFGILVPISPVYVEAAMAPKASVVPVSISIPSVGTNAPIISVGLTKTGNVDVPHNFVQAGWYTGNPTPGSEGSAIIDGHVDNGGYKPTIDGIFKHLDQAKLGDFIAVAMSDGTSRTFQIVKSAVYSLNAFPSTQVFRQDGAAYLKIITCHGIWLPATDTYSQRLVVTAVLVPTNPDSLAVK